MFSSLLKTESTVTSFSNRPFVSTTLGYTQHINVLVLAENGIYGNLLLEQTFREIEKEVTPNTSMFS